MRVTCVVGAQFGSEGKGAVVAWMANDHDAHVRVGGPNAGHTYYFAGKRRKVQALPVGWINLSAAIYIGAGAVLDPVVLLQEVAEASEVDPNLPNRIYIDGAAAVLDSRHHSAEGGTEGELHRRIGSTGEGVGACRHARMARDPQAVRLACEIKRGEFVATTASGHPVDLNTMVMTRGFVAGALQHHDRVLLEGTQGAGLSLVHGPWPYVTTSDCSAAQLCADTGIPVGAVDRVVLVARTYPIRVAGNSGPLFNELTWEEVSRRAGRPVIEQTTVTKKVRRVGEWDDVLFADAVRRNGPTEVVLTFADYLDPAVIGARYRHQLTTPVLDFVRGIEAKHGVTISAVGTGGESFSIVDLTNPVHKSQVLPYTTTPPTQPALSRAYEGDAGLDLPVCEDCWVDPGEFVEAHSGIHVEIPQGNFGMIVGRSSSVRKGLVTVPNVIDAGFRGELHAKVFNTTRNRIYIDAGSRVAQLVVIPFTRLIPLRVDELSGSDRGDKGHGSSGE